MAESEIVSELVERLTRIENELKLLQDDRKVLQQRCDHELIQIQLLGVLAHLLEARIQRDQQVETRQEVEEEPSGQEQEAG